jgi:hypothetical protein
MVVVKKEMDVLGVKDSRKLKFTATPAIQASYASARIRCPSK